MTSERKLEANQANGRKSRGPSTRAGKARASRNAFRHGLNSVSRYNPLYFDPIEQLAKAICDGKDDAELLEEARMIAECDILLRFVRMERTSLIERFMDVRAVSASGRDKSLKLARERFRQGQAMYDLLAPEEQKPKPSRKKRPAIEFERPWPIGIRFDRKRNEYEAMLAAMPDLARLDRYERRAWSRRNRAIDGFIAIRSQNLAAPRDLGAEANSVGQSTYDL